MCITSGCFILKFLEQDDIEITNVDAELFGSDHRNLSELENSKKYNFVKGNISNKKLMEEQIAKCDAVVNFAAESFVDRSINDANPFLVSNIRGAFTILDIITKQKKRLNCDNRAQTHNDVAKRSQKWPKQTTAHQVNCCTSPAASKRSRLQ